MTASVEALEPAARQAEAGTTTEASAPVLITVQEVAFSTAAAMPARRWAGKPSALAAAIRRAVPARSRSEHPPRGYVPKRYSFLDNACMSREMDRL